MTRLVPAVLGAAALRLAGCGGGGGQSAERTTAPLRPRRGFRSPRTRTVLQFLEDTAALDETWALCRNDPGGAGRTPECVNARHATERPMMLGRDRAIEPLRR